MNTNTMVRSIGISVTINLTELEQTSALYLRTLGITANHETFVWINGLGTIEIKRTCYDHDLMDLVWSRANGLGTIMN